MVMPMGYYQGNSSCFLSNGGWWLFLGNSGCFLSSWVESLVKWLCRNGGQGQVTHNCHMVGAILDFTSVTGGYVHAREPRMKLGKMAEVLWHIGFLVFPALL